jgi:vanillate O-demethylase ferredoxin subunit
MELLVSAIRVNGDDNLDIELMDPGGAELPPFAPGAHIDIRTPAGKLRQYSLCGLATDRRRYRICVRHDAASRGGSLSLHADLRVRARVEVSAPRNLFALPEADRYILVSAGIGITPIIAMARDLALRRADFELHHFERSRSRVAFLGELEAPLLKSATMLHLGDDGRSFRAHPPACLAKPDPGAAVLACGPSGFLDLLTARLSEAGWAPGQFHYERFKVEATVPVAAASGDAFEVRIASTGACFAVSANETIASVLLANGVDVDLSCEQGMCGACLTRVLEGTPDHRDTVLSEAEKAAGNRMTICCSRSHSPALVLAL